jgi:hypothetical protein
MQGHRVDEVHLVSLPGEPASVDPGATANVENHGRRRWQVTLDEFPGARQLQSTGAV